jgi:Glycosyltransferases, probably involved in cell wall biogenesis
MDILNAIESLDGSDLILLSGLGFCFIVQTIFYWVVFAKPYRYAKKLAAGKIETDDEQFPVSIIITIKNEFYDLNYFLPSILEQNYPQFEVIVVNDGSSDENELTLMRLQNQYPNLYATKIPDNTRSLSRKKLALSVGIKAAKYNYLLFMEADSCPRTQDWISLMVRHVKNEKTIVLGLSVKKKEKGFLGRYIAFDYLFSNLKFLTLALFNRPYAGDGHNLLYAKEHFEKEKGYSKYHFLSSGDDDLFINTIADKKNTAIEILPDSLVEVKIDGLHGYRHWKIDRESSAYFLKKGPVAFWRLESFSRVGFYAFFVACLIGNPLFSIMTVTALSIFFIRLLSQIIIWCGINKKLKLERPSAFFPFYDLFQPFVNMHFFFYRVFKIKNSFVTRL